MLETGGRRKHQLPLAHPHPITFTEIFFCFSPSLQSAVFLCRCSQFGIYSQQLLLKWILFQHEAQACWSPEFMRTQPTQPPSEFSSPLILTCKVASSGAFLVLAVFKLLCMLPSGNVSVLEIYSEGHQASCCFPSMTYTNSQCHSGLIPAFEFVTT